MSELGLMQAVKKVAGPYIATLPASSAVPPAFWGALTANESGLYCVRGLDPMNFPPRFEPSVYKHLLDVSTGSAKAYGNIGLDAIQGGVEEGMHPRTGEFHSTFLTEEFANAQARGLAAMQDAALRNLASSWGFTQVMGYNLLNPQLDARDLIDPGAHFGYAGYLMAGFCRQYGLNPKAQFREMFCCWNTGRPDGKCFDPAYPDNGVARMGLWGQA